MKENILIKLFKKYKTLGVVGNTNTGKSMLMLSLLIDLKKKIDIPIYILGSEVNLNEYLEANGLKVIYSSDDILDLKLKSCLIYIDEFGDIFDVRSESKQKDKIRRFFNRIAHLNNYIILASAHTKFWNTFICSLVKSYLVKCIEFDNLVNGTALKRKIRNISENTSDYRLDISVNTYYVITDKEIVEKRKFRYNKDLDSKKDLINPFKNPEQNYGKNAE